MSDGAALAAVAGALAIVMAGLFRLVAVLDTVEADVRRLVTGVRTFRRAASSAGELALRIERDADLGRAGLDRLDALGGGRAGWEPPDAPPLAGQGRPVPTLNAPGQKPRGPQAGQ